MSDSVDAQFWFYKGLSLFEIGNYEESLKSLKTSLKNDQENSDIYYNIAKCQLQLDDINSCVEMLRESIKLDPAKKDYLNEDPLLSGMPEEHLEKIFQ